MLVGRGSSVPEHVTDGQDHPPNVRWPCMAILDDSGIRWYSRSADVRALAKTTGKVLSHMRILIVDDDDASRKFLQKALEKRGMCIFARTGKEAIELVKQSFHGADLYDVIFLDIMMPIMDGRLALTAIRNLESKAGLHEGWGSKIIMATALGDYDNIRSAFRGQCDGYLVKPIKLSRLEALMANLKLIPRTEIRPH